MRKRALEVLGKDVTVDQVGDQFFNLQVEVNSAAFMDKDPGVRKVRRSCWGSPSILSLG